jgi:hypothetical protein
MGFHPPVMVVVKLVVAARVAHIRGPHFETITVVMDWDDTKTVTRQRTKHSQAAVSIFIQ